MMSNNVTDLLLGGDTTQALFSKSSFRMSRWRKSGAALAIARVA
jgi:hypothetical protein